MDEEGRLRNIFWADARSIAAYEAFGDVISFDTTYLKNKYDMSFAPFVGVNHHGQKCMSCKASKAIITNQCMAIQGAVRLVFPNSHHRLCLLHIIKKVLEKLAGLNKYKAIKKILKHITYEAVHSQEFEYTYFKMMAYYNIEKNEWLNSLLKIRDRWTPFVEQYDNAFKSKIEKENKADFASFNSFCSFQVSDIVKGKESTSRKQVVYNVYTNEEEFDIKCSCQLFEFKGIICRHICKVLIEKNVKDIHFRYILPRWRKDIKCMHTYVQNCYDDPQTSEKKLQYNKLCSYFTKAAELGAESNNKYNLLMKYVDEAIEKLMDNTICKEKFTPMLSEATIVPYQTPSKVRSRPVHGPGRAVFGPGLNQNY
ncbi:protein FAR1-RELATED SEQUENCE 6-like [Dioscorea cayenensis subsp. rotundata]|uniref:Protein FAR1-RELATED SEQUENCE 6-like n=1 Tax=Dioscorea cayennensis subsp. rotundata TaxID=55577 RepID=A0AB40CG09_DIOCR|nr:protein FAR1-RELATED SEQUENCE 6-like [Dioscorea cayenensis subsp. rotundata]